MTIETVVDGKIVRMTPDNIMIIPNEAPTGPIFKDKEINYVFPSPVSIEKVREVYEILTR